MRVGCDKKTSLAAAQTLAISAFFKGGDFVTFPLYPASNNLPIILSTSNTWGPPGLIPLILPLLIVALSALPGDSAIPAEGLGEGGLPGVFITAEGGGEVPRREERSPPLGEARMLLVVGIAGDPGTERLLVVVLGVTGPVAVEEDRMEDEEVVLVLVSIDPACRDCLPVADEKLDTDPARSELRPLRAEALGVESRLLLPTSIGEEGEEGESEERVMDGVEEDESLVDAKESARSLAESSLDRVRLIFLDGD